MTTKSFIVIKDKAQTLTNKTIDADSNDISNLETDNFKSSALSTSIPASGTADTKVTTEKAVGDYAQKKIIYSDTEPLTAVEGDLWLSDASGGSAGQYLPLTGGTLTGKLVCNNASGTDIEGGASDAMTITAGNDTQSVTIKGGKSDGASLELDGIDNNDGRFTITAKNSTYSKSLVGKYNGELTWNGRNVVTSYGFVGNLTSTTQSVSAYSTGGAWLLTIMGYSTVISRHTSDYKVKIGDVELVSGDTFYLGGYKIFIESIGGNAPVYLFGVAVINRTAGEFMQISIAGV